MSALNANGLFLFPTPEPPLVVDGSTEQLPEILRAIVDLQRMESLVTDSLNAARRAAAGIMQKMKTASGYTFSHYGLDYTAEVTRYDDTVCACHGLAPWLCERAFTEPIALAKRAQEPTTKVRSLRRNSQAA